jgi:galactoside O-acetyltransferase
MKTTFYTEEELQNMGFKKVGSDVLISRKASIYAPEKVSIGDNVRIDDFCILAGKIILGSHIHIGVHCVLHGSDHGITLEDYSGLSSGVTIYSAMDDFSGDYLVGSTQNIETRHVEGGPVVMKKCTGVLTNSIVFPNVTIGEGTMVGAYSIVNQDLEDWYIYMGVPARRIKKRKDDLLKFVH